MNWLDVSDWIREHTCYENQRYNGCNCGKRGKNPCALGNEMREICEALADGADADSSLVLAFVRRKTCGLSKSGQLCNHRGCVKAEEICQWIQSRQLQAA